MIDIQLGQTSNIYQIFAVPMQSPNDGSPLASSQTMLMVNGRLDIQNYGNVSSALYDGATWYPSILSTTGSGTPGTIRQIFYKAQSINYGVTGKLMLRPKCCCDRREYIDRLSYLLLSLNSSYASAISYTSSHRRIIRNHICWCSCRHVCNLLP
jgi:hypothetical protein